MPKIIIFNNLTEQMFGLSNLQFTIEYAIKSAFRNVWLLGENDIAVSPVSVSEDFKAYLNKYLNFNIQTVKFVYPRSNTSYFTVSDQMLLQDEIIDQIKGYISNPKEWSLYPCYYSSGVARLANVLGIPVSSRHKFFEQKGVDILNRKVLFRQIASGVGIPIPQGSIAYSLDQLSLSMRDHIEATGIVVIKQDSGAGGLGNIAYTKDVYKLLPGVKETRVIKTNIQEEAKKLWEELEDLLSRGIIIEEYHCSDTNFYLEFHIHEDRSISFSHSGSIILESNQNEKKLEWTGLMIPARINHSVHTRAVILALAFINHVALLGYTGCINIDFMFTKNGKLFGNEVNGRWGGGTVLDAIAKMLLGEYYYDYFHVGSVRNLNCYSIVEVENNLIKHDRQFDPVKKEGIVIISIDQVFTKTMECLILTISLDAFNEHKNWLNENYG